MVGGTLTIDGSRIGGIWTLSESHVSRHGATDRTEGVQLPADRRPRLDREELRALLLTAGRSILLEEGLGTVADSLNFKRAFDRVEAETGIKVVNASVIRRLWDNQAAYQTDVMVELASDTSRSNVSDVAEVVGAVLAESDLSTAAGRAATLTEVCRVVGEALGNALRRSAGWSVWMNLWVMATSSDLPDRHQRVLQALMASYEAINQQGLEAFGGLMTSLGYRLREPLTIAQFLNAAGALGEGCSLRDRVDTTMLGIVRPTGVNGEEQSWTIHGIGLHALVHEFFEPDPDV